MKGGDFNQVGLDTALKKALEIWVTLSGVSPDQSHFIMNMGSKLNDSDIVGFHKAIAEALELDPSNITGYFFLKNLSEQYFKLRDGNFEKALSDKLNIHQYMELFDEFNSIINTPELLSLGDRFLSKTREAIGHYNAATADVLKVASDLHTMALLRRDALKSMKNLRLDQFAIGAHANGEEKPVYVEEVHRFWGFNALIEAVSNQPSGVSLNLVMDQNDSRSFFAFAIKNGENIFILSDTPDDVDPLKKFSARRPDRELSMRLEKNHFPYSLLGVKSVDEDPWKIIIDRSDSRSLIPVKQRFDQLKSIRDLKPTEVIWTIMMFDLIIDKFWNQKFNAPEMSFSSAMIKNQELLKAPAENKGLVISSRPEIVLKPLEINDVKSVSLGQEQLGDIGCKSNQWMEDRYGSRVNAELLNVVANAGVEFYLEPAQGQNKLNHLNSVNAVAMVGAYMCVLTDEDEKVPFYKKNGRYELRAVDGNSFGTKKEIENDRIYIARHNFAKGIQKLADEEFLDRREKVIKWWKSSVEKNKQNLIDLCVNQEFWFKHGGKAETAEYNRYNFYKMMERHEVDELIPHYADESLKYISSGFCGLKLKHKCAITGSVAKQMFQFIPRSPEALAFLAGCEVKKLPDVLQHWKVSIGTHGNKNIDRVDPLAWALQNPWNKLAFPVNVAISVRGLNGLEKRLGNNKVSPPPIIEY